MQGKPIIRVDAKGYQQLQQELYELQREHRNICVEKSEVKEGCASENYHDNGPYEDAVRRETINLNSQSDIMSASIQIIEKLDDPELIDTDDIVTIMMIRNGKMYRPNFTFQLVGGIPDTMADLPKISVNSPLGQAVYAKKVNHECEYVVNDNKFIIQIIDKKREEITEEKEEWKNPITKK